MKFPPLQSVGNVTPALSAALLITAMCSAGTAQALPSTSLVVPNANASAEGNSNSGYPFDTGEFPANSPSTRYQEVFDASQFGSLSGPRSITGLSFRPDADTGHAFSSTLPDIRIDLSTTQTTFNDLSTTFADNVGADDTAVFERGALSLSSNDNAPLGGPAAFDIAIKLTQPFTYDPSQGNLLLDVRNFGGGTTTTFDDQEFLFASPSPVASVFSLNDGVDSPVADTAFTGIVTDGLVTQFTFAPTAVAEPPVLLLFGVSVLSLLGLGARRYKRR